MNLSNTGIAFNADFLKQDSEQLENITSEVIELYIENEKVAILNKVVKCKIVELESRYKNLMLIKAAAMKNINVAKGELAKEQQKAKALEEARQQEAKALEARKQEAKVLEEVL